MCWCVIGEASKKTAETCQMKRGKEEVPQGVLGVPLKLFVDFVMANGTLKKSLGSIIMHYPIILQDMQLVELQNQRKGKKYSAYLTKALLQNLLKQFSELILQIVLSQIKIYTTLKRLHETGSSKDEQPWKH